MAPLLALLLQQGLSLAASAVLEKGTEVLAEKTGIKLDLNTTVLSEDEVAKIKQAEEDNADEWRAFKIRQMEHEETMEDKARQDRDSARSMQMAALSQDDVFAKRFTYYFIAGWSLFGMAFIAATTLLDIPEANMRIVDTTQGFLLGTAIAACFNFLLGTTSRSGKKDDTINKLTKGAQP